MDVRQARDQREVDLALALREQVFCGRAGRGACGRPRRARRLRDPHRGGRVGPCGRHVPRARRGRGWAAGPDGGRGAGTWSRARSRDTGRRRALRTRRRRPSHAAPRATLRRGHVHDRRIHGLRRTVRRGGDPARVDGEDRLPELRLDPLSGLRTIVAGDRAGRPGAGLDVEPRPPIDPDSDPFLEGHEDRTPPELHALRPNGGAPNSPGWLVRVVPNLYPALDDPDADEAPPPDPLAAGRGQPGLFSARPAVGAHEVIVHTPRALGSLAELDVEQLETAMGTWRERMRTHADRAEYVHLIVNDGREAGASLPHTHAQLYALRFVPAAIARERERFTAWHERTEGRNLLEDLVQEEVRLRERVVAVDSEVVALSPYAARVAVPRADRAARATGAVRGRRTARRGDAARRPPPARGGARRPAPVQPVGAHGAARRRRASAGGSTCCRGSRSSRGSSSAPG